MKALNVMDEEERIRSAYQARELQSRVKFFGYEDLAHVFRLHERYVATLNLLVSFNYHPLLNLRILDVGCGNGDLLRQFLQWGAMPNHLAGIELRPEPIEIARHLNPNLDLRCGSATALPWPDESFDLVCQHTVFTSVLDSSVKQQIASEMIRVLNKDGAILWYDFMYNSPHNPDVRGVSANEIGTLFPGFKINLQRITLAPPLARRIPKPFFSILYPLLASIWLLRTHYLGLVVRPQLSN